MPLNMVSIQFQKGTYLSNYTVSDVS